MRRLAIASFVLAVSCLYAEIPAPKAFFGHEVCEDYWLADYGQLVDYWRALEKSSPRIHLQSIGKTEEGRDQMMAIITDPGNFRNLEKFRRASERLARGNDVTDDQAAEKLIRQAKAIVWIDGGLHASEVLGAQQLLQTAYDLVSRDDLENKRILRDCVILLTHANPDGMDLVSKWYMRRTVPKDRSLEGIPVLYEKYAGHDNNRDFYASNLAETRNINRIFYRIWYPQIVYNHHQSAPAGTIMFIPPFRNPFNYHVDPIAQIGIDTLGTFMHQRLIARGLGGTVMRNGAPYSGWWNGGLRTTTYFHNMIGLLTETWGSPNPATPQFIRDRQIPQGDVPMPLDIREWHLRDSLRYEIEANYAILDYASRFRESLLMNTYRMARNQIERGSRDNWTRYPSRIDADGKAALSKPEYRDARAYVLPSDAPNFESAQRFASMLLHAGIDVERLPEKRWKYPAGSLVIRTAQAFRSHVIDMFEPQDYPNDFQFPGGPPIPPYDSAGYTPAYTMGVVFDRVVDDTDMKLLGSQAPEISLADLPTKRTPALPGSGLRLALWDRYGGSMPSGWMRWLFEQFSVPYEVVFAPDLDRGRLGEKFDVIVFPSGAIPARDSAGRASTLESDPTIPYSYRRRIGAITSKTTMPALREFVESGGDIIAIGSSALNLAKQWNLPVADALVDEQGEPLPNTKFYIPGSVMRIRLNRGPLTEGMPDVIDVMFDDSPSFRITEIAAAQSVAFYESEKSLRSGWAWGQEKLKDTSAVVDVSVGKGHVVLVGPEITFRGQTEAAFPLLWNALKRSRQR